MGVSEGAGEGVLEGVGVGDCGSGGHKDFILTLTSFEYDSVIASPASSIKTISSSKALEAGLGKSSPNN